ncbi:MAG: hypothetical protein AAF900_00280 [Bacteroidota bacterium]
MYRKATIKILAFFIAIIALLALSQEVLSANNQANDLFEKIKDEYGAPSKEKKNAIVFLGDSQQAAAREAIIQQLRENDLGHKNPELYYIDVPDSIRSTTHFYLNYKKILDLYYNVNAAFIVIDYSTNNRNNKKTIDNLIREFFTDFSTSLSSQNYPKDALKSTLFAIVDAKETEIPPQIYVNDHLLNLSEYICTISSTDIKQQKFQEKLLNNTISINLENKTEEHHDSDDEKVSDAGYNTNYNTDPITNALFVKPVIDRIKFDIQRIVSVTEFKNGKSSQEQYQEKLKKLTTLRDKHKAPKGGEISEIFENAFKTLNDANPKKDNNDNNNNGQSNSLMYYITIRGGMFLAAIAGIYYWSIASITRFASPTTPSTPVPAQKSTATSPMLTKPVTPAPPAKPTTTSMKTINLLQPLQDQQDKKDNFKLIIFFIWIILGILCFGLFITRKYPKP